MCFPWGRHRAIFINVSLMGQPWPFFSWRFPSNFIRSCILQSLPPTDSWAGPDWGCVSAPFLSSPSCHQSKGHGAPRLSISTPVSRVSGRTWRVSSLTSDVRLWLSAGSSWTLQAFGQTAQTCLPALVSPQTCHTSQYRVGFWSKIHC